MQNSKLIDLLSTCDGHELKRFRVFLNSPFFNVYPEVIVLFSFLREQLPQLLPASLEKEVVFHAIWPDEQYDASKLRHLISRLCKLLETFWSVQSLMKSPFEQQQQLLTTYQKRNLDKYFHQTLRQADQQLDKGYLRDSEYYFRKFSLAQSSHSFTIERQNREQESSIEDLLGALDTWYFSKKLMFSCAAVNRQNILSTESELGILPEIQHYLKQLPDALEPVVEIYLCTLDFLQNVEDVDGYSRLLILLKDHKRQFPKTELAVMYSFALNYCIRQLNLGSTDYLSQLFELYLLVVEEELIFTDGNLPAQHFKNIVTVGLRLGRFGTIGEFVEQNVILVPLAFRENASRYSRAALHFFKQEHGLALRLLQEVEFTDVFYHLDAKSLLLKTYYELFDPDPLFSLVDTFRVYLRRNRKISEYQRQIYRNLVKYTNWLMRARLGDKRILKKLTEELAAAPETADLRWVEEKFIEVNEG